jgi:glycosyltransferase involved in cell wall biosynthesis
MKIVHITHHYIDGWGYQDNLLPLYQLFQGDDVLVVSDNDHLGYTQDPALAESVIAKGDAYTIQGVRIRKIRCYFNTSNTSLFCRGLYRLMQHEKPELILHHGIDSSSMVIAAIYKLRHPSVRLYVDNHADSINESHNRLWDFCYNRLLLSATVKLLGSVVDKYLGVTPLRCHYLHWKFGVPYSRIDFLPIGCDTKSVDDLQVDNASLRRQYDIPENAFIVASGGKMDASKGTLELMDAIEAIQSETSPIHLILFGKADDEVVRKADKKLFVTRLGWCNRETTLTLLSLADVACWPLLHTTLIEDAVACGTPIIVKSSGNVSHFEKEGNGIFLNKGDRREVADAIRTLQTNYSIYTKVAQTTRLRYSYDTIATSLKKGTFYGLGE